VTPPARQPEVNRRILSYTSYIAAGTHRRREIALTFDDGPGPYTPRVLAVLERHHVKGTFFEIGRNVVAYPRFTAELARAGMVIGDHTEQHPPMSQLGASAQAWELDETAKAIWDAGAPRPLLFRPPYGSFDATTLALLRERNMVMVLWTVDTSDYALPGVSRIRYTALSGARPGAIILFHDGGGDRSQTVAALPRIIERLRQRGYRLVTVPELLRDDPPPVRQPAPTPLSGD
jgi:peptidoglycan-N-acetylglucosamine deacetylase